MRKYLISAVVVLAVAGASFSGSGVAFSQTPAAGGADKAASDALGPEDRNASPFPAGPHAAVVKKVCSTCHGADLVIDMRFTREDAERFYKNMVSSDLSTDQAKQIIEYLSTTLKP